MRHRILLAVLVVMLVLGSAVPAAAQNRTHVVQPGETLGRIAAAYGVSWRAIADYNAIVNPNFIYAGEVLVIPTVTAQPAPAPTTFRYTVVRGDTLSTIADRYGTTIDAIVATSNITRGSVLFPGDVLLVPAGTPPSAPSPSPSTGAYYTVRPGDTLFRIAAYYNRNVYDIAEANGILNLNHIYAGQTLYLP